MPRVEWRCGPFAIVTYGNGLAYRITAPDGRTCYLQGDEASEWRDGFDESGNPESYVAESPWEEESGGLASLET